MNENLRTYIIPEGPTELGFNWFHAHHQDPAYRAAEYIVVPEGVTTIRYHTFRFLGQLQAIRIPRSVTTIEQKAILDCKKLSRILVDTGNPTFRDVDGVVFSKDGTRLIRMPEGREEDCYVVPEGVTLIGHGALHDCHSLRHVHLPASVRSIDADVFRACHRLQRITVAEGNPDYCAVDGVLYDRARRTLVKVPLALPAEAFAVPDSVEKIAAHAFDGCDKLDEIRLPDTLRSIGDYAFCDISLREIDIPASVTEIGKNIFIESEMLEEIRCHIPDPGCLGKDWAGFYPCRLFGPATLRVPAAAMEAYRSLPELGRLCCIEPLPEE